MLPLIERIQQRLPNWKGRWLNKAGRLALVTSVLSSMPTYHRTSQCFPWLHGLERRLIKSGDHFFGRGRRTPMVDTAWLTGQQSLDPKIWGAWECLTWIDLEELFGYVGYVKNGWRTPSHGSGWISRAVMWIARFSMPQSKLLEVFSDALYYHLVV